MPGSANHHQLWRKRALGHLKPDIPMCRALLRGWTHRYAAAALHKQCQADAQLADHRSQDCQQFLCSSTNSTQRRRPWHTGLSASLNFVRVCRNTTKVAHRTKASLAPQDDSAQHNPANTSPLQGIARLPPDPPIPTDSHRVRPLLHQTAYRPVPWSSGDG